MKHYGFTLIEILISFTIVVVLIGAVLAVINVPAQMAKGRDSQRISDIGKLSQAIEQYYAVGANYPAELNNLTTVSYKILKFLPEDPKVGNPDYCYGRFNTNSSYYVCAYLENATEDRLNGLDALDIGSGCPGQAGFHRYCITNSL